MRLALAMGRTVGELLESLDAAELTEWEAYDRLAPIGAARGDWHAAQVCWTLAQCLARPGERAIGDYLLEFAAEESAPDPADLEGMRAKLRAMAARGG